MAIYFFDSSAIIKRYIAETGTGWVTGILDPNVGNRIFAARITEVEVIAAITRRTRGGHIATPAAGTALIHFRQAIISYYRLTEITSGVISHAGVLAETYALRGYDAVQLSAALEVNAQVAASRLPSLIFVSADNHLNTAATAEGLTIDNPNNH